MSHKDKCRAILCEDKSHGFFSWHNVRRTVFKWSKGKIILRSH